MMPRRRRALADRRPDATQDRLQADPMLVGGKDLDRPVRVPGGLFGDGRGELFLKASSSAGEAAFGFFGRGFWIDQPTAFSASQPRWERTGRPS